MEKVKQNLYYVLISVLSFVSLMFLPMIGSSAGIGWSLPNTAVGWIIYVVTKLTIAVLNVLIFHCFMKQALLNVKDNANYKRAKELLMNADKEDHTPQDPKTWQRKEYRKKGISIFASSVISVFALTQAILTYDYLAMITYLFTIIMGVVFGIIQMKSAEEYWTQEYLEYAVRYTKKNQESKENTTEGE